MNDERQGLPSASSMERVFNCSASRRAENEAPDEEPNDEALEGQEIHDAMLSEDFSGLNDKGLTIAQELTKQKDDALEHFRTTTGEEPHIIKEERLWIREYGKPIASAKVDWAAVGEESALVLDSKTGYLQATKAYRNIQMRTQVLALWSEFPRLKRITAGLNAYRFKGSLDMVDYDVPYLKRSLEELQFKLWMSEQESASFHPGEWCRYCKARGDCRARAAFNLLPVATSGDFVIGAVNRLTPQQMAFMVKHDPIIRKALDATKDRMKALPSDVLASVGYELGKPIMRRELPSAQQVWEHLWTINRMYDPIHNLIELEEFQSTLKTVVGKLEELLTDKLAAKEKITKKDAAARAKRILEPIVTFTPTEPRLLPLKSSI